MEFEWPKNWDDRISGAACDMCSEGGQERNPFGARIFSGQYADGYLQSADMQRGYTLAIWNGRHVVDPIDLSESEASGYWLETLTIARALADYYRPMKLNYETLGNTAPHLHTHLLPRFEVDPRPGQPFPLLAQSGSEKQMPESRFVAEVAELRARLGHAA